MANIFGKAGKGFRLGAGLLAVTAAFLLAGLWPAARAEAAVDHQEPYHCIGIGEDTGAMYIDVNAAAQKLDILTGETTADIVWNPTTKTLTLTDLVWERTADQDGPFFDIHGIENFHLVLVGENILTRENFDGPAIKMIMDTGEVVISGTGTLTLDTDSEAPAFNWSNWDDTIHGQADAKLKNSATLTARCNCEGQDFMFEPLSLGKVSNSGYMNGRIRLDWYGFTDMVPYTTQWGVQVEHDYADKAYYFEDANAPVNYEGMRWTEELACPNHIVKTLTESPLRSIGQYDEDGYPILGNGYWQWFWITDEEWGGSREEENRPTHFLLYGEPETLDLLPTSVDKVQVDDGKTHVFNTDLRNLAVSCGNVTVNGNIKYTAIGTSEVVWDGDPDPETGTVSLIRDHDGVPITAFDSKNAELTVNGDVMSLSLSDTYKGKITLNGACMFTTYDHELLSEDNVPVDNPGYPSDLYAAMNKPGVVAEHGEFVAPLAPFEGWICGADYEGESFTNLFHESAEGEFVHGTQEVVNDEVITVDLGAEELPEDGFPFVRPSTAADVEQALNLLGDDDANIFALSISLISEGEKIQPGTTINLYLDGITGFTTPVLWHVKADGTLEQVYEFAGDDFNGRIVAPVDSFSTYFVAEKVTREAKFLKNLYQKLLGREADDEGLAYWEELLANHSMSIANILYGFFNSQEILDKELSYEDLVTLMYQVVLLREPEEEEVAAWAAKMREGMTFNQVLAGFVNSPEGEANFDAWGLDYGGLYPDGTILSPGMRSFMEHMYTKVLNREPEWDGFYGWMELMKFGKDGKPEEKISPRDIPQNFFFSPEYQQRGRTDAEFISDCYEAVLGRHADAEELQHWLDQIEGGNSRKDILKGFTDSQEFTNLLATFDL